MKGTLNKKEVAAMLGCKPAHVQYLTGRKDDPLPAVKFKNRLTFSPAAVSVWASRQKAKTITGGPSKPRQPRPRPVARVSIFDRIANFFRRAV